MNVFDVRVDAIRRRGNRRRPSEVRWHAAGRAWSRSFITGGLADRYRAELVRAARKGQEFSPGTGEPAYWAERTPTGCSWLEHAAGYAAMKWPLAAATVHVHGSDVRILNWPGVSCGLRLPPC